ncbi:MAG: MbcA/ParS/Xre antitoxin family protein [Parvularculaceae bacterium]
MSENSAISESEPIASSALREPAERHRLSAPAIRLFMSVADLWNLKIDERRAVLGDISAATYHNWRRGDVSTLTRDQLERISLVLGILKGMRLVFASDQHAFRWLKATNSDYEFAGSSPLERMTNGGISDLYAVRRYLDAWRGVR